MWEERVSSPSSYTSMTLNSNEEPTAEAEHTWMKWKCFNHLMTGIGCCKVSLHKWRYWQAIQLLNCECGTELQNNTVFTLVSHQTVSAPYSCQTVWERGRRSPFLIGWSVFHQESFNANPTIGWQTSCDTIIWNPRWRFYFLEFLAHAYEYL